MKLIQILFLVISFTAIAQDPYPKDYFQNPMDITLILSGTFAELRSNHFHSGLDIKTQKRVGFDVFAAASGHVSRIKISHYGYGKALYILHPNGYTTVYAHLQKFSPAIEAYIKKHQYEKETFEIELFPKPEDLPVTQGEVVAYSGNTGGSGGPHLHYEIRDNEQRPLNPLLFGIEVKDTRKPIVTGLYAYPMDDKSHINNSNEKQEIRLIRQKNGDYTVEDISAFGNIGFGIATTDRQDLASNRNGVYNIKSLFNGNLGFEIDFKRFSFDETKHLNRLIDYSHFKDKKQRVQKLFVEANNPLSIYKNVIDDGVVNIKDQTTSTYKIKITDYKDNITYVTIPIKGKFTEKIKPKYEYTTAHYLKHNQKTTLQDGNICVEIPSHTFYDDFYVDFKVTSDTLKLHKPNIPATKRFAIKFDVSNYSEDEIEKLYIANVVGDYKKHLNYTRTKRDDNILTARTKTLGTYTLATDTDNPTIKPINFKDGKWLSNYRYLKVKIDDKSSGISNYRATINGKWILMEYDYKTKMLVHDFNDNIATETKNNFKLIVTDNVGNSTTYQATFFRK